MNKTEMYAFITKNPMGYMATTDGNKPHVRGMGCFRADEDGIIYFTSYPCQPGNGGLLLRRGHTA